jgi:hypothetical protein
VTQTKRVLAAVGLVATTALAYSPMHTGSVAQAAVQTQTVRDLIANGTFVAASGRHIQVLASARQRTFTTNVKKHTVSSSSVKANSALNTTPGNGTFANVRANQDFGAFVPHQTPALAQEPLNSSHLTAVAEDTRLGAGPFVSVPNAYTGFYNSNDGGKTFTDGLVQNIANDPNGYYPSELSDPPGSDLVHGNYSFSDVPRLAFDKFGNLYVSSLGAVNNFDDLRNGLSDVLVTRSSAYQNTGPAAGPCPRPLTTVFTCAFDNPSNPLTGVNVTPGSSGRFFDGTQVPVPSPGTLPPGIPYVVDTNDAAGLVGGAFLPNFYDDVPNIAVDNGSGGSQTIYVTWTRFNFGTGTADIMYAASADGGQTFTAPLNIDPLDAADCINVSATNLAGTCDANSGSYPVVNPTTHALTVVFENFSPVATVAGLPAAYPGSSQLLAVTCSTCAGAGAPDFGVNGTIRIHDVVDVAGSFSLFGEDPDNGAFFIANSFPSASVDPVSGHVLVVWADARPNVGVCTSVLAAGAPCGGARVWEADATVPGAGVQVLPGGAADSDQLFPSITQSVNLQAGELTYVTFYTRTDAAGTDPYGVGVGNSQLNYTVTRNEVGLQATTSAPAEAVNANSSPMPLPIVNSGAFLTKYTQSVADQGGVHSIFVDTRPSVKNFNFTGAEDLMTTYIR